MNRAWKFISMKRITLKLSLVTSFILVLFSFVIYLTLYFFLPTFYERYKLNELETGVEQILTKSKQLEFQEAIPILNQYVKNNNASITIQDKKGKVVYPQLHSSSDMKKNIKIESHIISMPNDEETSNPIPQAYNVTKPIQFKNERLMITVYATLQPINEVSKVLILFFPYIGMMVLITSILGAYAYSRFITNPLLHINGVAKKMAGLDFTKKLQVHSQDELGELSESLNELSTNLQKTMFKLNQANLQLKDDIEKEREIETKRREFFSVVSHELKSPITAVKGQLEGMICKMGIYKDRDIYLKKSHEIMEDMEQLVREILEVSKLEQHTFKPKLENIKIHELIHKTTQKLEFFAIEKNIKIIKEIDTDIAVCTDYKLLEKAIKNIIHNAFTYSPPSEKVYICLIHDIVNKSIKFQVLNTGVFILEEHISSIFDPFYRVEKSRNRNTGGSGLGLYIVKQIFDTLSMEYAIKNTEEGVSFTVTIPIHPSIKE
ncbi:HAMP domain-containing protein (plasmid) [Bacillus sp. JAS24-2]|uniref:sensor histidine kinase n=1 Tax=Bacillus sp. JAS24-2 TaxID=2217832 RepID=UPI0011EC458E|nr:HAMP domain-containing sensor histidine kinase [Bacillus sp. JAS24-2]QEL82829.1 HAMP domain-containing protein [Bacillus sp. JAS24-2]